MMGLIEGPSDPIHHSVSENQRFQSIVGARVFGIKYGFSLTHVNDSDLCAVRALGINLSTRMITFWRRCNVKVNRLLRNAFPRTRNMGKSASRFPYEIVEMIIAHITRLDSLKACSLTCHFWYTVAAPRLHRTLILGKNGTGVARSELKPLSKLHRLGLMPLVKEIRVRQQCGTDGWFGPQAFSWRGLRQFSAFANVQVLVLQRLQLDRFMPNIERYFGHFSPSLRSIKLFKPRCTPRQLSYFLSLFPNLDDIGVWHTHTYVPDPTTPDTKLFLFSSPKLRGRLTLHFFRWVETWTHFVNLSGGLRFRYVDLRGSASCAPLLLEACAKTLETLRFNVPDGQIGKVALHKLSCVF